MCVYLRNLVAKVRLMHAIAQSLFNSMLYYWQSDM